MNKIFPATALALLLTSLQVIGCLGLPNGGTPQWRNQKQGSSSIPQGGYISLQAEGMDPVILNNAVLSTNETGEWRNETEYAHIWRQDAVFGFDNFGTPTYSEGVLYAPSKGDDNLYAVNASNGDLLWNVAVRQCDASPAVEGDVVYVGECMGPYGEPTPFPRALALDKTTGDEVWHFTEPDNYTWVGSPLVHDDYVYYTTYGSGVYALNKTTGQPIWHRPDLGTIVCSVAFDSGVVFVSTASTGGQYALNATTGEDVWHSDYGVSWDSSPVVYGGMVVQVTRQAAVWSASVLNETDGNLLREFHGKGSASTPLVHNGRIFIPSNDWRIWAYDLLTGQEVWHTVELHNGVPQNYSYCSPALSGGAIYYQALNGTFYVINATDGGVLWSLVMGSFGFGSPSIGDGRVFITNDFALYAFKIGPGSGDWPMFCCNNLHQSFSEQGVQYVRWPLTEPIWIKESNVWVTARFVWCNATITSAVIAWRIYFSDNSGNTNATDIMTFQIHTPNRDVTLLNITLYKTVVGVGLTLPFNVTTKNIGDVSETFDVTSYANDTSIGTQTVIGLESGSTRTLTFNWNTIGFAKGKYRIRAYAWPVPEESNTTNNNCTAGFVTATIVGDVDGNFRVDMGDINALCESFGSTLRTDGNLWHTPPCVICPHSPNCDVDSNRRIDMGDINYALDNFGKHYP